MDVSPVSALSESERFSALTSCMFLRWASSTRCIKDSMSCFIGKAWRSALSSLSMWAGSCQSETATPDIPWQVGARVSETESELG